MNSDMKSFTDVEKRQLLSRLLWDLDISVEGLLQLLNDEIEDIDGFGKINLYQRLLTTYDWYTLLRLLPVEKIKPMLADEVLNRLFPRDLRDRFIYARSILSR